MLETLGGTCCGLNKSHQWLGCTGVWPGQASGWIGGEGWTRQRAESSVIQMMGLSAEKFGNGPTVTQPTGQGAKPRARGLQEAALCRGVRGVEVEGGAEPAVTSSLLHSRALPGTR